MYRHWRARHRARLQQVDDQPRLAHLDRHSPMRRRRRRLDAQGRHARHRRRRPAARRFPIRSCSPHRRSAGKFCRRRAVVPVPGSQRHDRGLRTRASPAAGSSSVIHTPTGLTRTPTTPGASARRSREQYGPWSADASFKSPVGAFLRNGELRDPLTIGRTVGTIIGTVTFTARRRHHQRRRRAPSATRSDQTVTAGEFSLLAKNIKNAAPGGKSQDDGDPAGLRGYHRQPLPLHAREARPGYPSPARRAAGSSPVTAPVWDSCDCADRELRHEPLVLLARRAGVTATRQLTVRATPKPARSWYNLGASTGSQGLRAKPDGGVRRAPRSAAPARTTRRCRASP